MFRILAYDIDNPIILDLTYCVDDTLKKSCTCVRLCSVLLNVHETSMIASNQEHVVELC